MNKFKYTPHLYLSILLLIAVNSSITAQPVPFNKQFVDSVIKVFPFSKDDTNKINSLVTIASMYIEKGDDQKVMYYAKMSDSISKKVNYPQGRIQSLSQIAFWNARNQNWPQSINAINEAIPICKKYNPAYLILMSNLMFINYATKNDLDKAYFWVQQARNNPLFNSSPEMAKWPTLMQLGLYFDWINKLDSAQHYANILAGYVNKYNHVDLKNNTLELFGNIARKKKDYKKALECYHQSGNYLGIAWVYDEQNISDSAIFYAKLAIESSDPRQLLESLKVLSRQYAKVNPMLSNQYLQKYADLKDTLFNSNKLKQVEEIQLNEQKRTFDDHAKEIAAQNRIKQLALIALALLLFSTSLLVLRNNQIKQKANKKLGQAYKDLQSTQAQLIQSEKMASLGELTAGIAHEIQNPLNFVNNFSEINNELIKELEEEANKEQRDASYEHEIIATIKDNSEKINHHGKRAESIVHGMLQHSRKSTGVKERTDINALADEYLRLSYHGLKAKNKSFNADYTMNLDSNLSLINVIPQDIGRVLLNIFNNAFWASAERGRLEIGNRNLAPDSYLSADRQDRDGEAGTENANFDLQSPSSGLPFSPQVTLITKNVGDHIEIRISDNGPGISPQILDKIFQPFFTTKPAGQGTGLGLSLAYDIVKAHGGELKVVSEENVRTEFVITLPV